MNKEAKILVGLAVATLVVLVGGAVFFSKPKPIDQADTKVYDSALLLGENSYEKGNKDAKVTIVEFGDFQCPACASSHPITKQLLTEYADRVRFVFRHFPLEQHAQAVTSALAAESAGAQGKFWEMHDALYEKQNDWAEKDDALARIEGYAKDLGLNMDEYKKAMRDKTYEERIRTGLNEGVALGVSSTPTFFINGQKLSGLLSLSEWKRIVEAEIAK